MATITATYLGDLRVESVHAASGARLITDAPVDNNGKGEGVNVFLATRDRIIVVDPMGEYSPDRKSVV